MLSLTCAVACTSDPDDLETGTEMAFEAMEVAGSRAVITTSATLKNRPFMLFGDMYRTGEFYAGRKELFFGRQVTFKNNKWDYGATLYWLMGQEHTFVAIHPYLDSNSEISGLEYSDSKVSFTYTLPKSLDDATDILVAAHRRKYYIDSDAAVRFKFNHLLSCLNIMPALDEVLMYEDETNKVEYPYNKDEYILFQRIELIGIKTKAAFSFTPEPLGNATSTDGCKVTYEVKDGLYNYTFDYSDKPVAVTNNKQNVSVFDNNKAVLILPQSFADDSTSEIRLYYSVNDDLVLRKITIPLKGVTWNVGTNYTYKFTIEKAYTGQIKAGSFTIDIDDPQHMDDEHDDAWVWDGKTIDFTFD
ncbi:MAG: fimbrillin family protein [Muribaculaceae bacterium]|nr:fimbrillin family protein [Muribaculaceae bacterium]